MEKDIKRKLEKVEKFKREMLWELANNTHKGDWEEFLDPPEIHKEISYHLLKLQKAEDAHNKDEIKEYIADCANILMFLGNAYGLYD